ncbi:MAG: hypothetical protein ABEL97_15360 [Salinibacter sp.]
MSQASYQNGLTVVTLVRAGHEDRLSAVLDEFQAQVPSHDDIPFEELTRVHFMRWVLLPATTDDLGRETPAQLVLSTNYDEPLDAHLEELVDVAGTALDRVYRHCAGYDGSESSSQADMAEYLRTHDVGYDTLYVGTRGRTVPQIRREATLRNEIQGFLDRTLRADPSFREQSPAAIRGAIQSFVRSTSSLDWAEAAPPDVPSVWPQAWDGTAFALVGTLLLLLGAGVALGHGGVVLGLVVAGGAGYLGWLRWRETHDEQDPPVTDYDHVAALARQENRIVQNEMSSVTTVKAGWLRQATLRTVLWVIDLAGRYVYTHGRLGSISSIHFARWVVLDEGRRLLFCSNFDGSWENYLGEFIDRAASGLTAVWSNTVGFPRTRFLIGAGARDEQRFKAYARNSQVLTQVWYSAYRDLTVQNINNNSAIRAGLFGEQTPEETRAWLRRL